MIKRKTTLRTSKWSDAFHIDDPRFHLIYISQIDWNRPLTLNAGKKGYTQVRRRGVKSYKTEVKNQRPPILLCFVCWSYAAGIWFHRYGNFIYLKLKSVF